MKIETWQRGKAELLNVLTSAGPTLAGVPGVQDDFFCSFVRSCPHLCLMVFCCYSVFK